MGLAAACVLPGSPTPASAEPSEPAQWVKTGDDSVVKADTLAALRVAANQFRPLVAGAGFNANDLRNLGAYTLRLVTSGYGDIEAYRDELQQMVNEINTQTSLVLQVAPGTVAGPGDPLDLSPALGEIWVMISSVSPCGTLAGGTLGCGGTYDAVPVNGEYRWASGTVWLSPTLQAKCQQPVTSHEVSHALGLAHFDQQYLGEFQIMKSSTNCSFSALRAGDLNGHRWLVDGAQHPSNDNVAAADEVCALRDTTMSAVTRFASTEAGEPAHAGLTPLNSVWYRYTPRPDQVGGTATIKTTNDGDDDFDTVLAVYTGSMFSSVVPVASNDDFTGLLSQVSFVVGAGVTYWIAVDSGGVDSGETDVVFDLPSTTVPPAPAGVPARLVDTRRPGGQTVDCFNQAGGRITANSTYEVQVTGRAFVPANATSVVLNVTALTPSAAGFMTVFPCGQAVPNASNLNFAAGEVIPNLVIAKVGIGGKVCIFTSAASDLLVDVSSYFLAADGLTSLVAPERLLDTRIGSQTIDGADQGVGRIPAGVPYELLVAGRPGVPVNAATVVLNVTAVAPGGGGYVTVYPCGQSVPNASNLNYVADDVIPNLVLAKPGALGKVCFFSFADTDLLVDVSGYFANNLKLQPLVAPGRVLDTRSPGGTTIDGQHQAVGRVGAGATYELPVLNRAGVTGSAPSVVLNVTAVTPSAGGFLTVFPCGQAVPNASNLNFVAGDVIPNSVISKVGAGGKVCIFTSVEVDLLVDVSAFFLP